MCGCNSAPRRAGPRRRTPTGKTAAAARSGEGAQRELQVAAKHDLEDLRAQCGRAYRDGKAARRCAIAMERHSGRVAVLQSVTRLPLTYFV